MLRGVLTQRASDLASAELHAEVHTGTPGDDCSTETRSDLLLKNLLVFGSAFLVIAAILYVVL